jgi:UDP-N-acetylmuramate--alanine ligase
LFLCIRWKLWQALGLHVWPREKLCIVNGDDVNVSQLVFPEDARPITYGDHPSNTIQIKRLETKASGNTFELHEGKTIHGPFTLHVPGNQNIHNATAAIIAAQTIGISNTVIASGLATFLGAKRRCEYVGEWQNAHVFDDYAHHPQEIMATIAALREWYPTNRLITVFQPHTYSRTKQLFSAFATAFWQSTRPIFVPIYASAREKAVSDVSSESLTAACRASHPGACYQADYDHLKAFLLANIQKDDILLFLGAGDIGSWAKTLVESV